MTLDALNAALARTTEDLARAIAEGSGSVAIQAIADERSSLREQIREAMPCPSPA